MGKNNRSKKNTAPLMGRMSHDDVVRMVAHGQSGAAGVHADQNARRHRVGKTNRVGSRSARRRAAIDDQ